MKLFFINLKYKLLYRFGRKYKYCFDCLWDYKFTKTDWKYMRCYSCIEKFKSGKQG